MHPHTATIVTLYPPRQLPTLSANDDWTPDAPASAAAATRRGAPMAQACSSAR
jgi:hypothetical protein